jgi:spore maturation protein CgeB
MKIAIIDKNPNAHLTQWRAAGKFAKYFTIKPSLKNEIEKYNPDIVFINKGYDTQLIAPAIKSYKSIYFYGDFYRPIPNYVRDFARICNAVVLTNKDPVIWYDIKKNCGQKNIHFVSQGADPEIFNHIPNTQKTIDILFPANYIGNNFCGSERRLKFVRFLQKQFEGFAVIGSGWPKDIRCLSRKGGPALNEIINQSKITVGMNHFINVPFYTSNRIYQCMATGTPHIAWYSAKVNKLFKRGYIEVKNYSEFTRAIKKLLDHPAMRIDIGTDQFCEIINHHTIFHTWSKIEKIMESL